MSISGGGHLLSLKTLLGLKDFAYISYINVKMTKIHTKLRSMQRVYSFGNVRHNSRIRIMARVYVHVRRITCSTMYEKAPFC